MSSTDVPSVPPAVNAPSTEVDNKEDDLEQSLLFMDKKEVDGPSSSIPISDQDSKSLDAALFLTEEKVDQKIDLPLEEVEIKGMPAEEPKKVTVLRKAVRGFLSNPNDNMAGVLSLQTWTSVNWYLRFLEVHNSTKKATKAIKANQEWRETIRIEKYEDFRAEIAMKNVEIYSALTSLVGYRHGSSKSGRPVKVMRILSLLSPKEIQSVYQDNKVFLNELDLLQAKESEHHHFAVVPEMLRQKKTPDHYHISIIDLDGCSTKLLKSGLGRKTVKAMLSFDDKHYPNGAFRVFLINVPKAFSNVWSLIKRFLSKSVTSKIVVLKKDVGLGPLFEFVDQSELPKCIGGTSPFKLGEHPSSYKL